MKCYVIVLPDGTPYPLAYLRREDAEEQAADISKDLDDLPEPIDLIPVYEVEVFGCARPKS